MICIDFQGGAHGNYLEFVCNKIMGLTSGTPFNLAGAAHAKKYVGQRIFIKNHHAIENIPFGSNKVISIQITPDDLLPLQQISLLRAGDYGYNNDELEINTYHKLNNIHYRWILDHLIDSFFKNQIKESYDAVKDPSWPEVNDRSDYVQLPQWIQDECKNMHNLSLLELNKQTPDCPRHILREFFQIGFADPQQHGFFFIQKKMIYPKDFDVFVFPFSCFYNTEDFLNQIKKVAEWAGLSYNCQQEIEQLHDEFLQRQPYKDSKVKCDKISMKIQNNTMAHTPAVDLLEEAYINAKLGWNYFV